MENPILPSEHSATSSQLPVATLAFEHELPQPSIERLSIDDLLKNWVGEFGRSQILNFTLTSLAWTLEAMHTLVTIFADKNPTWRCRDIHPAVSYDLSGSAARNATSLWSDVAANSQYMSSLLHEHDVNIFKEAAAACTPGSSLCSMNRSLWVWTSRSQSTVSEWELVCENSFKQGMVQSAFFIGSLVGAGLFGSLSDSRLGRKGALAIACASNAICGMLTAASPNYWVYFLLRAGSGVCCGGLGLTSFVLGTESVGPSRRSAVAMSAFYFYSLGIVLLSGLASLAPSWRYLYVIISAPSVLYCLCIVPLLAESPRWYLVRGRSDEALSVLKSMAATNGKNVPAHINLSNVQDRDEGGLSHLPASHTRTEGLELRQVPAPSDQNDLATEKRASGTLVDVFRGSTTRIRMIILVFIWFSCALSYYLINLNVGNLGTNLYLSVLVNGLAEVPGYAITAFLLNRTGRRTTLIIAMFISGFSCLTGGTAAWELRKAANRLPPPPHAAARFAHQRAHLMMIRSNVELACGLLGLFAAAGTYNLLFLYTAELFPTVVRNAALGLTNQAAAIGAVMSPIILLAAHLNSALPFFVVGAASLFCGVMAISLPETLDHPLHETLEGMRRAEAAP